MKFQSHFVLRLAGAVIAVPLFAITIPGHAREPLFHDHRNWYCVNKMPMAISAAASSDCHTRVHPEWSGNVLYLSTKNPHSGRYITVYVNEIGRKAMLTATTSYFPVGSVIVKEKAYDKTDSTLQLSTVMVKHRSGCDTPNGDWEYMVLDADNHRIDWPDDTVSCQNCHEKRSQTDFVFRTYLPNLTSLPL